MGGGEVEEGRVQDLNIFLKRAKIIFRTKIYKLEH